MMRLRAPVPDDAPAVHAVLVARDLADLGAPDYTLEDLREEWQLSEVDLATDAIVAECDDGKIVAYAITRRLGTLAIVAPGHEDRGIGTRLLEWSERRDRDEGRTRHRQWIASRNERAHALVRAAGYEYARTYSRMVLSLDDIGERWDPPAGTRLRPLDVDRDAVMLHALDAASFGGLPDYEPESLESFIEQHLRAHDLVPALSRVAERDDHAVGFLLARRRRQEQAGFVDILAVHPDYRRRGLATALLHSAFSAFASAGLREAQLGVASDNPRALRLYERVGMTARFQLDTYERPVAGSSRAKIR